MVVPISTQTPLVRLEPQQELKLTKTDSELYIGQGLKAVVLKTLNDNQVLININGQNLNARTSQHLAAGELLHVKVVKTEGEIVLQILREEPPLPLLHSALLRILPQQAPATQFLASLFALQNHPNLPTGLQQPIQSIWSSMTTLEQLSAHFAQAMQASGLFLENLLAKGSQNKNHPLMLDFKGQCLRIAALLENVQNSSTGHSSALYELPIPGMIPKPLARSPLPSFLNQEIEHILPLLREQTNQTLARIESHQLLHLLDGQENNYTISMELPLYMNQGAEVIAMMLKQHKTQKSDSIWSMDFALHLDNLGDIQAKVILEHKNIHIQIHSDLPETATLLESHEQTVAQLLSALGLTLKLWSLQAGLKENEANTSFRLLDIKI
ncbi:flagellar hook-length control protein FliK [Legionella jordanis]|uniref:flagellar hook-length control protein FliK n=1 Tax=Legionella jordanis TaxID=456 RepID=UPI00104168E2|nr:flagellar hook-length control protein FliK [Legionella jordanis]